MTGRRALPLLAVLLVAPIGASATVTPAARPSPARAAPAPARGLGAHLRDAARNGGDARGAFYQGALDAYARVPLGRHLVPRLRRAEAAAQAAGRGVRHDVYHATEVDHTGDGTVDVTVFDFEIRPGSGVPAVPLVVTAYDGTNGRKLWHHRADATRFRPIPRSTSSGGWLVLPLLGGVGPDGRGGVVLASYTDSGPADFRRPAQTIPVRYRLTLTALSGTGQVEWTRTFEGWRSEDLTRVVTDLPILYGTLGGAPGQPLELLVGQHDLIPLEEAGRYADIERVQPVVVNGADGTAVAVGPRDVSVPYGDLMLLVAPDLSGDGRGDWVVLTFDVQAEPEDRATLVARRSVDGEPLWQAGGLAIGPDLEDRIDALGNVAGDEHPDLLFRSLFFRQTTAWQASVVLDGATGAVVRERLVEVRESLDEMTPLGDVDGDGRTDVVTETLVTVRNRRGVRLTVQTVSGRQLYTRDLTAPVPADRLTDVWSWVRPAGDLDADGVGDLYYELTYQVRGEPDRRYLCGYLSGRTGRTRADDSTYPLDGSVDGVGADVAYFPDDWFPTVSFAVRDGRDHHRLWSARLSTRVVPRELSWWQVAATARLDRDRCAEVFLTVEGTDARGPFYRLYVLDGRTGTLRWSIMAYGGPDGGATVRRNGSAGAC